MCVRWEIKSSGELTVSRLTTRDFFFPTLCPSFSAVWGEYSIPGTSTGTSTVPYLMVPGTVPVLNTYVRVTAQPHRRNKKSSAAVVYVDPESSLGCS